VNRFSRSSSTGRGVIPERLAKRSADPRITLQELEEQCGLPPGSAFTKLASMRVKFAGDWAGRPSVTLEDAAKVYAQVVGDNQDHEAKWQAYNQYVETRERRREQAARDAAARAREDVSTLGTPLQESRASKAADEARQAFEAGEPLRGFEEFRVGGKGP
jgi:hypothetical protein